MNATELKVQPTSMCLQASQTYGKEEFEKASTKDTTKFKISQLCQLTDIEADL